MSFTPTKKQLEEFGFIEERDYFVYHSKLRDEFRNPVITISAKEKHEGIYVHFNTRIENNSFDISRMLFPQSLEDLKTIIRLLTPP